MVQVIIQATYSHDAHWRHDGQNPLHCAKLSKQSASGSFVFVNVALADMFDEAEYQQESINPHTVFHLW